MGDCWAGGKSAAWMGLFLRLSSGSSIDKVASCCQLAAGGVCAECLCACCCPQGTISDMREEKVVQPLLVTSSALNLATECVRMILKVRAGWGT